MKKENINIFIHRRDFRIQDNLALNQLIETDPQTKIFHIFIFNPKQIDPKLNKYFSKNSVEFLVQSLHDLNHQLNDGLHCFLGTDIDVLSRLILLFRVNYIAFNKDYTPYAIKRDNELIEWCNSKNIGYVISDDYTLFSFNDIKTKTNTPYEVFTPFYNTCLQKINNVKECVYLDKKKHKIFKKKNLSIKNIDQFYFNTPNPELASKGGRTLALGIINKILAGKFSNYKTNRDYPYLDSTTHLSAYIKYGCISIREVFVAMKKRHGIENNALLRELIWREFYAHIAYHFPRVLIGQISQIKGKNHAFKEKYDNIAWEYNDFYWKAFTSGETGFPFIDAGIRQLLTTGWCHNRARMAIASFASKDLRLPPNDIERWFASNLIDYDPCSNSGGIQWCYSIGSDAQPYFRIFNPFTQALKFDPQAKYIKNWIPELKDVKTEIIHKWEDYIDKDDEINYPSPIVNHHVTSKKTLLLFTSL